MGHSDITAIKADPKRLLDFLREHRYAVYYRSNIFFRDFQYGLWRYLKENRTKVPYADMEKVALEVIGAWERQGAIRRIDHQSFELNMPEYLTVWPTAGTGAEAAGTPKEAPIAARPLTIGTEDAAKDAALAALKEKMAAAKARREAEK